MDVESCAAAAVLGAVPALGAVGPCRGIPTGHGTRGVLGSVLFCLGDLLAEQGLVLQQLFLCGEKVGWIEPVSHLFQQLDCAEMDGWLPEVAPRCIFYCQRYQQPSSGVEAPGRVLRCCRGKSSAQRGAAGNSVRQKGSCYPR